MDGTAIVALATAVLVLVALAVLAWMFWRGSWLFLVAGRAGENGDEETSEGRRRLARRMAARARSARLDHLPMATLVFTIAFIAVIALVGVLFAGV